MDPKNYNRIYASMGLALQVGCLAVVLALGSLFVGIWLDRTLGTGKILTLICVALSVPINLFVVLRVTQLLVTRLIPPDRPKTEFGPPSGERPDPSVKDKTQ
jgi:hypothetical protein